MSNIFKTNSRFSSLIDDIPQKNNNKKELKKENLSNRKDENKEEKFNSFKSERIDDRRYYKRDNSFNETQREKYRQEREAEMKSQKEFEEKEKEKIKTELLNINNFPELFVNINKEQITKNESHNSYIEKLKKEEIIKVENKIDPDLVNLKPGWVLFMKDKNSNNIIIKKHPKTTLFEKQKSERKICVEIANELVKLHERRTQEYIELNGYDTWEKMFKFPNWQEEEIYSDSEDESEDDEDNEDDYGDEL